MREAASRWRAACSTSRKPLPSREVTVSLEEPQGRGEIRLLEQPRESNGYRARVLIRNPQAGPGDYSFRLAWPPAAPKDAGFELLRRERSGRAAWMAASVS